MAKGITSRATDYSKWYGDVIAQAELADYSPVKGCMVIRPNGYAIWEAMQRELDARIKATGHENAYFPIFIPESFLTKEKEHVEGFAPECAVVTHGGGKELEEKLYVRPTSETIMYAMFSQWIQSWRDLPLLINQWANVVRWEMRTRLFLRTLEFLWQEGHTAHETFEEAEAEARKMLGVYQEFAETVMAIPVIPGKKTDSEKFRGALHTYCIEAMMQDHRALQAGTSHHLGQNFSKPFDVKFQARDATLQHVWQTSWGVSTRLIGAVIMVHSDDHGLVLPPKLAPQQVVAVPIWQSEDDKAKVTAVVKKIEDGLAGRVRFKADLREQYKPGWKFFHWEARGVPLRLEIGPRDVAAGQVVMVRRDTGQKTTLTVESFLEKCESLLAEIQQGLFDKALAFRKKHTHVMDSWQDFTKLMEGEEGFVYAGWCGKVTCEEKLKNETKATIRCIPDDSHPEPGKCLVCNEPSRRRVIYARAY
ncbi:MAG: proline--tRNA ligase [Planctomycetes bacterium]|nr:proline--tRNA ligase [Planctomycetota bacterium]MBI3847988.1 proline--tRNA ligase [Planctomycetota bacterium]